MRAEITDFWAMVFNPSAMHRLNHVLLGSLLQGAFFVMSLSAFYLLKKRHVGFAKRTFTVALVLGFVSSITILISGHAQANAVAENQPAKLAAFEGHFETGEGGADLYLFGWPDEEAREVKLGVALPGMLSFLIHGDTETPVKGLDRIPDDEEPPVAVPFVTYHLMVALGMFFIGVTSLALFLRWRGTLWDQRWLLKVFVVAVAGPYIANQTGWVAAEVGRQPWVVYGLLKTQDAASPSVPGEQIFASIVLFSLIYLALGALWVVVMNSKIQHGPEDPEGGDAEGHEGQIAVAADVLDPASPHHLTGRAAPEEA